LPATTTERHYMSNLHQEKPGKGVMYWEAEEQRKSPSAPDFKGFVVLEMDYKAGEKLKMAFWLKNTSNGNTLLAIKEDNYSKRMELQKDQPREVQPRTQPVRVQPPRRNIDIDDGEVPF